MCADGATRNAAEETLKQSFATDPANHLCLLSQELQDETAPLVQTRSLAGLTLKNHMTSKDHVQVSKEGREASKDTTAALCQSCVSSRTRNIALQSCIVTPNPSLVAPPPCCTGRQAGQRLDVSQPRDSHQDQGQQLQLARLPPARRPAHRGAGEQTRPRVLKLSQLLCILFCSELVG